MDMQTFSEIKRIVAKLRSVERQYYLSRFLAQTHRVKQATDTTELAQLVDDYIEIYDELFENSERKTLWNVNADCTHVHIVFGDSAGSVMKMVLKSAGWSDRQKVIVFHDHYAIGPLHLHTAKGREQRYIWFQNNIAESWNFYSNASEVEEEYIQLIEQINSIPSQAQIIIWADDNAVEEIGSRYALSLIQHLPNSIVLCNPCALVEEQYAREHPGASIRYSSSGEMGVSDMEYVLKQWQRANSLEHKQIKQLVEEWNELSRQSGILRILENGQIRQVSADYFDAYLLQRLDAVSKRRADGQDEFCQAAHVIGEAIGCCDHQIGDAYFEYRLRELIYSSILEIQGLPAAMRYYSVRRKP